MGRRSRWHDRLVAGSVWDGLTEIEHRLMVSATETWGILPYACSDADSGASESESESESVSELAAAVLSLVDRGMVEVRRLEPWTAPDGRPGVAYGVPLDHDELPVLLADPDTWDDPTDESWVGEVALTRTDGVGFSA